MLKGRLALNASALMISSAATGLLGLVYWMIAERMMPTSEVGRASAMVSIRSGRWAAIRRIFHETAP